MVTIRTRITELIGRVSRGAIGYLQNTGIQSIDFTRIRYDFWDQLRRGYKPDYALGALFTQPILNIISSWTLGRGIRTKLAMGLELTEQAINDFIDLELLTLIRSYKDSLGLGDTYIGINPDGTLIRFSPNQVEALAEPRGSNNIIGYKIITVLPDETITDEYYIDRRVKTTKKGGLVITEEFPNLIGMLPIVHWANDPGANEIYGHPYYEQLLTLFSRYNKTLNKSLDGVDSMGNPIPTISGAEDPDDVLTKIATGTHTYTGSDGKSRSVPIVDLSQIPIFVLGKDTDFNFKGPASFTQDSGRMLEYLFLLMLQTTQIPEWCWGGAIASSKASVDAQFPAFDTFIQGMRMSCSPIIVQIIRIWLSYRVLYDRTVQMIDKIPLKYGKILIEDRAQTLASVTFARQDGEITRETGLTILDLVDDPNIEVESAQNQLTGDQTAMDLNSQLPGPTQTEDATLAPFAGVN